MELMPIWGNPKLLPSRAWHSVAGVEADHGSWTASIEAYDKRFGDLVTPDPDSVYSNEGNGYSRGVEVLVRRSFAERLAGWAGYSRSVAKRRDRPGKALRLSDYDIPDSLSLVARWLATRDLALSGRWHYASGTPYTRVLGERTDSSGDVIPIFGEVNGARLPPYRRLDLRLEYAWRLDDLVVVPYVELLNALDSENLAVTVWSTKYGGERRIKQLPRIAFFGVEARF